MLEPYTEWAQLEKFPFRGKNSANVGHTGQDHNGRIQKTDQAGNVEPDNADE